MLFKKKCPVCGTRNSKERLTCLECGSFLSAERDGQRFLISSSYAEVPEVTQPGRRAEEEYYGDAKILLRISGQAGFDPNNLHPAAILVIEGSLIIKREEPLKIPLSQIDDVDINYQLYPYTGFPITGVAITFFDEQNKLHRIFLFIERYEHDDLQKAIYRQIAGKYIKTVPPYFKDPMEEDLTYAIREFFRDKTRDDFYTGLEKMGIEAKMAVRGRFEENIRDINQEFKGYSLGIIGIEESPISWINIRKIGSTEGENIAGYFFDYAIIDTKLTPGSPYRTYHFTNSHWEGSGSGIDISDRLNNDPSIKKPFLEGLRIAAIADYGCWIITKEYIKNGVFPLIRFVKFLTKQLSADKKQDSNFLPSTAEWECYQTIAQYLRADRSG